MSTSTLAIHISIFVGWRGATVARMLAGMGLDKLFDAGDVIGRADAATLVHPVKLRRAVRCGALWSPLPGIYTPGDLEGDPDALLRAAHAYVDGRAAFSHTTALAIHALPVPEGGPIHLMADARCRLRGTLGVRIHRRAGFTLEPPQVVPRGDLQVVRLEQSIVDSWPLLECADQRAPAICAVARRMTTANRLREALTVAPRLAGRGKLAELINLIEAGCHSMLELWGYEHVFAGPAFASLCRQVPVRLGRRTIYLDALDPGSGVNFELDGATHHTRPTDRERDLRRDAQLTALGLVVVRLSHRQLTFEVEQTRRAALAMIASHRQREWTLPDAVRIHQR